MNKSLTISDSLIGSLCREIEYVRQRYKNVSAALRNTRNKVLKEMLLNEILELQSRRSELINISYTFSKGYDSSMSRDFLYELCNRPLEYIYS